jgi:hypothetical protein
MSLSRVFHYSGLGNDGGARITKRLCFLMNSEMCAALTTVKDGPC